jgi:hypothetical protein
LPPLTRKVKAEANLFLRKAVEQEKVELLLKRMQLKTRLEEKKQHVEGSLNLVCFLEIFGLIRT